MTKIDELKKLRQVTETAMKDLDKGIEERIKAIENHKRSIINLRADIKRVEEKKIEYTTLLEDINRKIMKILGYICDCGGEFKYSHDEWEISVYKCDKCGKTKSAIHGRGWVEDLSKGAEKSITFLESQK